MAIMTLNPATGEVLETFEAYDEANIDRVLESADRAQRSWARVSVEQRAERLLPMADLLRQRVDDYARLITVEMGKPIAQARAEVEKCATCVEHYAHEGPRYLRFQAIPTDADASGVRYLPLGVVLGVMPWNYPFWQVLRFAIPTIVAGNGVVLKHASNVPRSALALEQLAADSGLPHGLFGTVLVEGAGVAPLIHDRRIAGVSLTGSEAVGRKVGAEAGAALKRAVLELGGSDPFIVLADANIPAAARAAAQSRTLNNGQSCVAAKRFLVADAVHDDFVHEMVGALRALKVGDPMDPDVELGPMARADLRDELHQQLMTTAKDGAEVALGGEVPDDPGAFYPASLLVDVTPGMLGFDEELFGPVGVVVRGTSDDHLVELANASRYGLGSSIWTADVEHALHLGERVESGMVFINGIVKSDPRIPFGGVKASGFGRELGPQGIREFVNVQTTWAMKPGIASTNAGVSGAVAE
jgi:succinate-semialdehyde dehydrogenase/glutarate-semialdehyde dehydrogenase